MTQNKFQAGDVVYITASGKVPRTINSIYAGVAELIWECTNSSAIDTKKVSLDALRHTPFNPRTELKEGSIVSYTDHNGKLTRMTVRSIDTSKSVHNPSVVCQWFEGNTLRTEVFSHSLLEKVFGKFYSLSVSIHKPNQEIEELYLGTYTTHEECVDLIEKYADVKIENPVLDRYIDFTDVSEGTRDIFQVVTVAKVRHIFSVTVMNKDG